MKNTLLILFAAFCAVYAPAQNRLKDKPEAVAPAADDWLYLDGATHGVRKLAPDYFLGLAADGKTLVASGAPGVGTGADGDVYLRLDTGGVYTKAAGAWTLQYVSSLAGHTHAIAEVSGLQTALDFKQPLDTDLTYLAGFTPADNVKSLLNAADYAAIRTLLALVVGTNVQAYDADLTTYAGIAPSANVQAVLGAADYAAIRTLLSLVASATTDTTNASNITTGTLGADRLAGGTGLQVLRRNTDNTGLEFATISVGAGDVLAANNLSDLASAATAFANIKQAATTSATGVVELATDGETAPSVVVQGNDSRLSNARTPSDGSVTATKVQAATLVIESEGIASNDNDTTLPTSAAVKDYADTAITAAKPASRTGTHASPDTTGGAITWTAAVHVVWTNTTTPYALPAAAGYDGRAVIFHVTGTNAIAIDPNGSEVIVREGTAQTGGVTLTLAGVAGNFVCLISDGTRWITLGKSGTLAAGS